MEPIKTINSPKRTSDNKDLLKKKVNKKGNKKEIKIEKPILFWGFLIMILLYKRWNFKKL